MLEMTKQMQPTWEVTSLEPTLDVWMGQMAMTSMRLMCHLDISWKFSWMLKTKHRTLMFSFTSQTVQKLTADTLHHTLKLQLLN